MKLCCPCLIQVIACSFFFFAQPIWSFFFLETLMNFSTSACSKDWVSGPRVYRENISCSFLVRSWELLAESTHPRIYRLKWDRQLIFFALSLSFLCQQKSTSSFKVCCWLTLVKTNARNQGSVFILDFHRKGNESSHKVWWPDIAWSPWNWHWPIGKYPTIPTSESQFSCGKCFAKSPWPQNVPHLKAIPMP